MKLTITENEQSLIDTLGQLLLKTTDSGMIKVLHDNNVTSAVITGKPSGPDVYELVVECVRRQRLAILNYIFDNKLASPNFISHNGSHIVLFAMQADYDTFAYMIAHGSTIVDGNDFVKNPVVAEVTTLMCSAKSGQINRALCNIAIADSRITDQYTINKLIRLAIIHGIKYKYIVSRLLPRSTIDTDTCVQVLNYAIEKKCKHTYMYTRIIKDTVIPEVPMRRALCEAAKYASVLIALKGAVSQLSSTSHIMI